MQLYDDIHAGTGPYMLMVYGFLSSRAQWRPNLAALARVARPVVLELWGHGRSPAPEEPALYHPDAYIAAFDQLRIQLGVERWYLCGQSLGAALTLRYALTHPERVIAQVFTNSSAALADAEWITARRVSGMQQAEDIERDGHAALKRLRVHPMHARRLPPELYAELLADAQLHTPRGIANALRYTTPYVPVRERVKDLQVPTLLVCGERATRFLPNRLFAERTIPGLQVVGANAGHAVNIQAAEVFNTAAVNFLRQHL
jgi:2-succinyl-6-hydroxy-2,4-cyclohexadiene-1-carboxylate synthase